MKKIVLIILVISFFTNNSLFAQVKTQGTNFPASWLGTWAGEMYIMKANSHIVDTVDVTFEFLPTKAVNRWMYKMTYKNPKYGNIVKAYELSKPDSLPQNTYLLDELDGIMIEEILMGNSLYSTFSVSDYRLFSTLRKEDDDLFFEIVTTKEEPSLTTKNKAENEEDAYEVKSFLPFTTQFVRFHKVSKN